MYDLGLNVKSIYAVLLVYSADLWLTGLSLVMTPAVAFNRLDACQDCGK
jgi:hypothetical protein